MKNMCDPGRIFPTLFYIVFCLSISAGAYAAKKPPSESWTFTGRFENDLFANTDRFYTSGIKLNWVSPDLEWFKELPWLAMDAPLQNAIKEGLEHLPFSDRKNRQRHVSLSVGHKMYTPQDIETAALIPDDRPYAGWLFGSAAFHSKSYNRLDSFEIQAGFTGDWSLAEETQNFIHSIRGIEKARGWDNQIDTELAVALIYDHKHRYIPDMDFTSKWGFDAISSVGGAVGNAFTHINAGFEVRAGWNLPADFGTALIRPGGETNAPADRADPRYQNEFKSFSFHLFAAVNGRAVLHDIFLDGNTFSDSHSVSKETFVGDFVLGASLSFRRLKFAYSHVLRTKEFKRQPDTQQFGSISISYTY